MTVMAVARFERFFRLAASIDVDKADLERYDDFINARLYALLVRGAATAKANGRDVMLPRDVPITKGLQECIHAFGRIEQEVELQPILDQLARHPPLDAAYGDEIRTRLPGIAGGLSVALARTFKLIDPGLKNPGTDHWQRASDVFDLLA